MKNLFLIIVMIFSLISCNKDEIDEGLAIKETAKELEDQYNLEGKYSNQDKEYNYIVFFYKTTLDLQYGFRSNDGMVVDHLVREILIKDLFNGHSFGNNRYTIYVEKDVVFLKHEIGEETRIVILNKK